MPTEEIKRMISLTANGDLTTKQHYLVKMHSVDGEIVLCGLGERPLGALDNVPAAGYSAAVAVSGRLRVVAGATITRGQELMCDATGKAIPALDREGWTIGMATNSVASGAEVSVLFVPAYQQKGIGSFIAGENLSAAANLCVKVGAAAGEVLKATAAGEQVIGVVTTGTVATGTTMVRTSGKGTVKSGAAFAIGARLMSDANGKAVVATTYGGERVFAVALEAAGGADETVDILMLPQDIFAANQTRSMVAGAGGVTTKCFVKADATANQAVLPASAGESVIGVALSTALAAASARIQFNGVATVTSGAAVTAGDRLEVTTLGKVITYTGAADRHICGVALSTVGGGDLDVNVLLVGPGGWYPNVNADLQYATVAGVGGTTAKLLVKQSAVAGKVVTAGAGEAVMGAALSTVLADAAVNVQFVGVTTCTSGGIVTAGNMLECDAAGKVVPYTGTANNHAIGFALSAAGGADVDVTVILLPLGWEPDLPNQTRYSTLAGVGGTTAKLLVKQSAVANKVIVAGAGEATLGVALATVIADAAVSVQFTGTATVTSGAAITAGNLLECDAAGKAVPYSGVQDRHVIGVALTAAGGADVDTTVLLVGPSGWEQDLPDQRDATLVAAAGGITTKLFVKAHTVAGECITAALGNAAIGVAQNGGIAGASITVQFTGRTTVTSGAAVNAGAFIEANAAGKAITADGVKGRYVLGVALSTVGGADLDLDIMLLGPIPQLGATITRSYNGFRPIDTADWTPLDSGCVFLPNNKAAKRQIVPIDGVNVGETMTTMRVVGALGASLGNHTTVDAILKKATKAAGAPVVSNIDNIATVDVEADTALDAQEILAAAETVATDFGYAVLITCTTAADATCDVTLTHVEIDFTL